MRHIPVQVISILEEGEEGKMEHCAHLLGVRVWLEVCRNLGRGTSTNIGFRIHMHHPKRATGTVGVDLRYK
jgi:hypothetical protein